MTQEEKSFGRADADTLVRYWNLFHNRSVAYSPDHPVVLETVPKVLEALLKCMGGTEGSLSLLFQEAGYYIGHVDLVYQANNRRIADHLRRFGIESISITPPLDPSGFARFLEACSLTHADPARFLQYLTNHGLRSYSVNDVSLQTVKEGDTLIQSGSRSFQGTLSPLGQENQAGRIKPRPSEGTGSRGSFDDLAMKVVLGHLTAQEMSANLGILKMLENSSALPEAMLKVSSGNAGNEAAAMKQSLMNVMGAFRTEAMQENVPIEDVLAGMYGMRAELLKAVKAQQGLALHLNAREEVEKSADDVFVTTAAQLVMAEYQRCKGNPKRMAQVVQRIVPDRAHLQNVLTLFRGELQKTGAPLIDFYHMISELNLLMGTDRSYREFLDAGQSLGISPEELIKELQADPKQAAQLIILASEARKAKNGNPEDLINTLTDYMEKAGDALGTRVSAFPKEANRLTSMLREVEAEVNSEMEQKGVPEELRQMGQQKLRLRMNRSISDLKGKAALAQLKDTGTTETEKAHSLIEMFGDEKEMEEVMGLVRELLDQDSLARDLADQVLKKVRQEMAVRRERIMSKELPAGVYAKAVLDFFIKSEISRSLRYEVPFTAMLLSFQGLPEDKASHERQGDALRGLQNILIGDLRHYLRDSDFVGYITFNRFLAVLPMTKMESTPAILRKFRDNLTRQLALPDGSRIAIYPRCGVAAFDRENTNTYQKLYAELSKSWSSKAGG